MPLFLAESEPIHPSAATVMSWWGFAPVLVAGLLLFLLLYLRGWMILWRRGNGRFPGRRLAAFAGGLATIYLALQSPLDELADRLLSVHMLQHLVLWFTAPLLIWMGAPYVPVLLGLPRRFRTRVILPILGARRVRAFFRHLTHPGVAFPVFVVNLWLWHVPRLYDLALRHDMVHEYLEHTSFLLTGLVFWWPVLEPYPAHPRWSRWLLVPYLFLAGVQGTVLSGILTFSDHVIYRYYLAIPHLFGVSPLADQAVSGVVMWIPGSIVYLTALTWVGAGLLYGAGAGQRVRANG